MKNFKHFIFIILILTLCLFNVSCDDKISAINIFFGKDIDPPVFLGNKATKPKQLELFFNEPVHLETNKENAKIRTITYSGNVVFINLNKTLEAYENINLSFIAFDNQNNSTAVNFEGFGYNDNKAKVLINEFTTKGTDHNPDKTEILITKGGNLAGFTLYQGSKDIFDQRFIFPNVLVEKGNFIIIYWTEEIKTEETNTFCVNNAKGLPSLNGSLSIYDSPSQYAKCEDAVLWDNHEGVAYNKFGNKTAQTQALSLIEDKNWESSEEITGLLAVNSVNTTSTRSFARYLNREDHNNNTDWYIVATRGSTFGSENNSPAFTK